MNAVKIVYWYDRHERSWVSAAHDAEGNQIGDAQYSGTAKGRDFDILQLRKEHSVAIVEKLKPVKVDAKAVCQTLTAAKSGCDWEVRKAVADHYEFVKCGQPGVLCTTGPDWQRGHVRCHHHKKP